MEKREKFISDFESKLYKIDEERVKELSLTDESGSINNLLSGIIKNCHGVGIDEKNGVVNFLFADGVDVINGYILKLPVGDKNFYESVMFYSYFLSLEFENINTVELYNTYLYRYRTLLELKNIYTVPHDEIEQIKSLTGDKNPYMFYPFGIEIIPFFEPKDFYKRLLNIKDLESVKTETNYVYLIFNNRNGYFKIGRSKNPIKREKTLQSEEPDLELLFYKEADMRIEYELQKYFKTKHIRGEWFKLNIQDILIFKKILSEI